MRSIAVETITWRENFVSGDRDAAKLVAAQYNAIVRFTRLETNSILADEASPRSDLPRATL